MGKNERPVQLTVWEDFRCPACGQFENAFRSTIQSLEQAGKLKVEYHLVTLIDGNMGGRAPARRPTRRPARRTRGSSPPYHDVLYATSRSETDDAFAEATAG